MQRVNIKETNLEFYDLQWRDINNINFIVIHHVGSDEDYDVSAETIHQWHLANGWSGCGYNYIIRKDGTIERGRPVEYIPSHCYGYNSESIGLNVAGSFSGDAYPTSEQIEAAAMLLANLCSDYGLPIDRQHITGHRDWNDTSCPGDNLYYMLDEIIGKANWYANN